MLTRLTWFNTYLLLAFALLSCGCQSVGLGKKKEVSTINLHLEVNRDGTGRNYPVGIGRTGSFQVNVERDPFLKEVNVINAGVVDDGFGGFNILLEFDRQGTWVLEQFTTAHKGKRIAIFSLFGQGRWLAAPVITKRIGDGTFVFTPDATREEADRIVRGLNIVAKEVKKENR